MGVTRVVKEAFLVGVTDYGNSRNDLPFCERDVQRLAEVLSRKGFTCTPWVDRPLHELMPDGELKQFASKAKSADDTLIFYFSGHGIEVDGVQILQGRGTFGDLEKSLTQNGNLLVLSSILDELSTSPAQKILIIDACRVPRQVQTLNASLQKARRTAFQKISNCVVVYASADGTESFGTQDNSASRFTLSLTEELKQYGRGVLPAVEAAITRVASLPDQKRQTPWIYASLRDRPIDGFLIEEGKLEGERPQNHLGRSDGKVWAVLAGSDTLAKLKDGKFHPVARLTPAFSGSMFSYDPHPGGDYHAFVKPLSKVVHLVDMSDPVRTGDKNAVHPFTKNVPGIQRVFGAWWSPAGTHLVAFGAPHVDKLGLVVWSGTPQALTRERVEGLPLGLEITAATWRNDSELLIAGTRDGTSRSQVYTVLRDGTGWTGSCGWISNSPQRITSILVASDKDRIYFGADDGSVAEGRLSADGQPEFVAREHATSGLRTMVVLPWIGESRQEDYVEIGVCSMALDETHNLLGLTYFDGTVAFWDPVLRTYVKSFPPAHARRPRIICTEPGVFLCTGSATGRTFRIIEM